MCPAEPPRRPADVRQRHFKICTYQTEYGANKIIVPATRPKNKEIKQEMYTQQHVKLIRF